MAMGNGARLSPETCRANAEECRLLAKQSAHRIILLHMGETWERIAEALENENGELPDSF
jgi:hypothetical protein